MYGELTVASTGSDMPMLAGNVVALLSPLIFIAILTLIFGRDNFDFNELKRIQRVIDADEKEKDPEINEVVTEVEEHVYEYQSPKRLPFLKSTVAGQRSYVLSCRFACLSCGPCPCMDLNMSLAKVLHWLGRCGNHLVILHWLHCRLLPLWDGRKQIYYTVRGLYWDCTGQSSKLYRWQNLHPEDLHDTNKTDRTVEIIGQPSLAYDEAVTSGMSQKEYEAKH